MKNNLLLLLVLTTITLSQTEKNSSLLTEYFFNQPLPGDSAVIFAPGIVSDTTWGEHCQVAVFPDGKYFFFMRHTETQDFF